jgi:molybdopterin-guanine dinucleotide biosynthesis protein A
VRPPDFDALVLAGGAGRRLGGADKATIEIAGLTLLDRTIGAVADAHTVVIAGPVRVSAAPGAERVRWCREEPPGGGPVAGLAAGLVHLRSDLVVVLAVDMPRIAPAVAVLVTALDTGPAGSAAAVLVDLDGRHNFLAAAWRRAALEAAVAAVADTAGTAMHALYSGRAVLEVPDPDGWGADIDTAADVDRARNPD